MTRSHLAVLAVTATTFGAAHIGLTAGISAVLTGAAARWRRPGAGVVDWLVWAAVVGAAVLLYRWSANLPQLNSDGLSGFSANDWLTPVVAFVALTLLADARGLPWDRGLAQTRVLAVAVVWTVNVVTI